MATQKLMVTTEEIKDVIKKTIKDVIKEGFFKIRLDSTPEVSDKEMAEIEEEYKEPNKDIVCSEWTEA